MGWLGRWVSAGGRGWVEKGGQGSLGCGVVGLWVVGWLGGKVVMVVVVCGWWLLGGWLVAGV